MPGYAEVIVSLNVSEVDRIFHYVIPEELSNSVQTGVRVMIPFGGRTQEGYIIGITDETDIPAEKLKPLISVLDKSPVFSENALALAKYMREKYYTTLAASLMTMTPYGIKEREAETTYALSVRMASLADKTGADTVIKNAQQKKVFQLLLENGKLPVSEIKKRLNISASPIETLSKNGLIVLETVELRRNVIDSEQGDTVRHVLNKEQQEVFSQIQKDINTFPRPENKPKLIYGVTGSGKTEIYMRLIEETVNAGRDAIVLVPEISLTPQTVRHFHNRFGKIVSVTHSRLSAGERLDQWKMARDGKVKIMIGPRSALFTPFSALGIVIIDEEHENTYRSESNPKYDAREIARELCHISGATLVLGSATPSVETFYKAKNGEVELFTLSERVNKTPPEVFIADMRYELANGNRSIFSEKLKTCIAETLVRNEQIILFLNRRGYSTFVSCRSCGYAMTCDDCSVNYTYHEYNKKLICHYCGKTEKNPEICPVCGSKHIKFFGAGTQKIQEEAQKLFPEAKTLRMDMDTTSTKNSHAKILQSFAEHKADILIGTQMIAKGLDFPNVTLVGVVAADLSLNSGDFRSSEKTFQLLTQVAGRAGRANVSGRVVIQSYNPQHYAVEFAKDCDYNAFYEHEIVIRRQMQYPPYSHIFSILFTGEHEKEIIIALHRLKDVMQTENDGEIEILGPTPAMISKIKKNYRWKILAKSISEKKLKDFCLISMQKLKENHDLPGGISVNMTLDPAVMN